MIINFSNLGGGGGSYTLPTATSQTLGGVKIGSGVTVTGDGTISVEGSDSSVLKSVAELPSDAELGDVVSLASSGESYPNGITYERRTYTDGDGVRFTFPDGSLTGYTMDNPLFLGYVSASTTLAGMYAFYDNEYHTYNFSVSSDGNLSDPDINVYMNDGEQGANPFDGAVFEFDIVGQDRIIDVYPDASMGVTSIVFEGLPEGGSLGVFQYDGDNWNQIGAGGGSADYIPEITELPETPVDGAIYNYNGTLIKYVNGAGNWGVWAGCTGDTTYIWDSNNSQCKNSTALNSAVEFSANTTNNQLICSVQHQSYTNRSRYFFIDNTNSKLNVYDNSGRTGTTIAEVAKDGSAVTVTVYSGKNVVVKWEGNIISFTYDNPCWLNPTYMIVPSASTGHYEMLENGKVLDAIVYRDPTNSGIDRDRYFSAQDLYFLPKSINANYQITRMGAVASSQNVKLNGARTKAFLQVEGNSYSNMPDFWAPVTSGTQGNILVSDGQNGNTATPPVWKTIAQALGVDFWTGTQTQYEALGTHSNTTIYFIIPE